MKREDLERLWKFTNEDLVQAWKDLWAVGTAEVEEEAAKALAVEILMRGMVTLNPDSMTQEERAFVIEHLEEVTRFGIYLVPPYGKQIHQGEQVAILKDKDWPGLQSFNTLRAGNQEFGYVRFHPGELIDLETALERQDEHRLSLEDIRKFWPDAKTLYFYRVRDYVPLEQPRLWTGLAAGQVFILRKQSDYEEPGASAEGDAEDFRIEFPICKVDKSKRLVTGVVLVPEQRDLQGDIYSAEVIEKAAHDYMIRSQTVGVMHKSVAQRCHVVESYTAPVDMDMGDGRVIKKGSWVLTTRVNDDGIWAGICSEKLTGYSIGGKGNGVLED